MAVDIYDMTPIETTYTNKIGLRIVAFFSAEVDGLVSLEGCQLMQTRRGGYTVHLPQHRGLLWDGGNRGPVTSVRFLDRSVDRDVEQAALEAYRQAKQAAGGPAIPLSASR